jgi:guanine deaminase
MSSNSVSNLSKQTGVRSEFNIIATLVQTPKLGQLEILHNQLISIDAKGFILSIHPQDSPEAKAVLSQSTQPPVKLPEGAFLTPTFVDLHFHAPQFLYLGTGLHLPLMQWLDQYAYKAEEGLDADPDLAEKCYARLAERLIEAGTGAVLAFGTIKAETKCESVPQSLPVYL